MSLIHSKIPMAYFYYKNINTRVLFFPYQTTWRHSNKAGEQAVPLVATHKNDKAFKK